MACAWADLLAPLLAQLLATGFPHLAAMGNICGSVLSATGLHALPGLGTLRRPGAGRRGGAGSSSGDGSHGGGGSDSGQPPAVLWSPRGGSGKLRGSGSFGAEGDDDAGRPEMHSLLDACLEVAAAHFDDLPQQQLDALPADLVQKLFDTLTARGGFSPMRLARAGSPAYLDALCLSGASCGAGGGCAADDALLAQLRDCPHLRGLDVSRCTRVGDAGVAALAAGCPRLQSVQLNFCVQVTDAGADALSRLPRLLALQLCGCEQLTGSCLPSLARLSRLERLDLGQCLRLGDSLEPLAQGLPALRALSVAWCTQLGDAQLVCLSRLTGLTHLDLSATQVTDAGIFGLSPLRRLAKLKLSGCGRLTSGCAQHLSSSFGGLTRLELGRCIGFGDAGAAALGGLRELRRLGLSHTQLGDMGVAQLSGLSSLTFLELESTSVGHEGCCALLASLRALRHLDVTDTEVTNAVLQLLGSGDGSGGGGRGGTGLPSSSALYELPPAFQFSSGGGSRGGCTRAWPCCPELEWLSVADTRVSGGLEHLKPLTGLTYLNVDSSLIGSSALQMLSCMTSLTALDAFSAHCHDCTAPAIACLTRLRRLELCGGCLGNSGAAALSPLTRLTMLSLAHNPRLGDAGAVALLPRLPRLEDLNLSGTGLRAAGAKALAAVTTLRFLCLLNTAIPDAAAQELAEKLPPGCAFNHSCAKR